MFNVAQHGFQRSTVVIDRGRAIDVPAGNPIKGYRIIEAFRWLFLLMVMVAIVFGGNTAHAEELQVRFKPVPPIQPIPLGKLSPAYDWILREHIRGMYCYVGEFEKRN